MITGRITQGSLFIQCRVKVKVKLTLEEATKAQRGAGIYLYFSLISMLD
jgi:hypothetical protein